MTVRPNSWAARILGLALAVLVACWAINLAAQFLVAVLPILGGIAVAWILAVLGWRLMQRRQSGW